MAGRGAGGADLGNLLGTLMQSSNSSQWKKQTPVLSSNEVWDNSLPLLLVVLYHAYEFCSMQSECFCSNSFRCLLFSGGLL